MFKEKPMFLFSAGWRTGSTLLQRAIIASGKALIWGEAGEALNSFSSAEEGYVQMLGPGDKVYSGGLGGNGAQQFDAFKKADRRHGVNLWIPCMNPPIETIHQAFRHMFDEMYGKPARELGYRAWGVKEVRSGIDTAKFLKRLYPDAQFVFLVRNPIDCLTSLKRHNWMDRPKDERALEYYAHHWVKLASEFRTADFGMLVRYEDFISQTSTANSLMSYLGLPEIQTDFISESRVKGNVNNESGLGWRELRRAKAIVLSEMQEHGYKMSK